MITIGIFTYTSVYVEFKDQVLITDSTRSRHPRWFTKEELEMCIELHDPFEPLYVEALSLFNAKDKHNDGTHTTLQGVQRSTKNNLRPVTRQSDKG